MTELPRTLCCPVCGRELGIAPIGPREPWSRAYVWLAAKLRVVGLSHKGIARVLCVTPAAVNGRFNQPRRVR
jgi:hypothetical protein